MVHALLVLWAGILGGIFGSFLNVVVYRLPRRKSLFYPPSHCPKCKYPIRWHDNVPVFGWMRLNGRCRKCKVRISSRYPLVEALCAIGFASLAFLIVVREGCPRRLVVKGWNSTEALFYMPVTDSNLYWGVTAYLLLLLLTLLAAGLIEVDGKKIPGKMFVPSLYYPAALAGLSASLFFPSLHWIPCDVLHWPVHGIRHWINQHDLLFKWGMFSGAPDAFFGAVIAAVAGCSTAFLFDGAFRKNWIVCTSLLGLYLGWQHAVLLIPTALLFIGWVRVVHRRLLPILCLTVVTYVGLIAELLHYLYKVY